MDKLQAMTAFVRIAEKGSLTAAAETLNTSLPSVVRTLAALERHLGVRLLHRTTRRLRLTDEGAQYLERCRAILSAVQDAEAILVSGQTQPQGRLAVTASVLFGRRYVVPLVNDFLRRFPQVTVDLLLVDRLVNMLEEGLDVGLRIGHLGDSTLVAVPVGQVRRVVCASPEYLRQYGAPLAPEDLRSHRCVHFTSFGLGPVWSFGRGRRQVNIPVNSILTCNQVDAALDACVQGLGIGMFLSYQVAPQRSAGRLDYVLEAFEPPPLPVQVVYPSSKLLSSKVRAFVDACVATLRQTDFG
jgi:DNA-binding transcriptional LysR family regulator